MRWRPRKKCDIAGRLVVDSRKITSDPIHLPEVIIIRSSARPGLESTYNAFLYAAVGEDKHGAPLTVLTALARQNVDPWDAAADLTKLPSETALRNLQSLLAALPGQTATIAEQAKVVSHLMALLPRGVSVFTEPQKAWCPLGSQDFSAFVKKVWLGTIYIALVCFTAQWLSGEEVSTAGQKTEAAQPLEAGPVDGAPSQSEAK
jgi:hypothetical protein